VSKPTSGALSGPVLWCLFAALLFGASTPLAKLLLDDLGPFTLAGLLYLGAALSVLPAARSGGSLALATSPRNVRLMGGAVLFGGIVGPVLLLFGLQQAPAASVSLWLNLETIATALLAWLFFKEDMAPGTWLAVSLVLAGSVALALPFVPSTALAIALLSGAALAWGLDNNLTSLIDGFTPAQSTLVKGLVAGSVNLGIGVLVEGPLSLWDEGGRHLIAALVLGGLGYGASLVLYVRGAQHLGATRSQLIFAAASFFGMVVAWSLLGEPVLWLQGLAALLMGTGIVLMLRDPHGHQHRHVAATHTHSHRHDDGHHSHQHEGLAPSHRHTHEHEHGELEHSHSHRPDLHHRHEH
jgi:drug/metabolite transporter (DMT)-like permease